MPYHRWDGPSTPTFLPQSKPDQASYIDHLAIWDPKGLTIQIGPTQTIVTSFLDHNGVLGKTLIPLLILPANSIRTTVMTPRVPTFKYPIPPHTLAASKSHVAIDSHSPTSMAIATANATRTHLRDCTNPSKTKDPTGPMLDDRDIILSLATYLYTILGEAMHMATTMFPLKAGTPGKKQTRPHHISPKTVLHDVHTIRNRTKAFRRLVALAATTPLLTLEAISDTKSPHHKLWLGVTTPLTLRTMAFPPIRNLEALSLTYPPKADGDTKSSPNLNDRLSTCFKAHRRTTRLLLKHARN